MQIQPTAAQSKLLELPVGGGLNLGAGELLPVQVARWAAMASR
ncbi:hypothetical protein [Streptomyces sp. NPDC088755]